MLVALAGLGLLALRRGWSVAVLFGIGVGLWLFTRVVIMPLTSAGLFAVGLLEGTQATVLGYLAVGLAYAGVLALAHAFLPGGAVVKTMTRIAVPARDARLQAGLQRIAGVAYAGDRGIQKVEYSADGGQTWQSADLTDPPGGRDTWVRWQSRFSIALGDDLALVARASDGAGTLQHEPFTLAQPDGAGGWNTINVTGA